MQEPFRGNLHEEEVPIFDGEIMTYCENCGSFIDNFQDGCDHCGMEAGGTDGSKEPQMYWFLPIMPWEDHPWYSAVNGRRLKDTDTAFCLSSMVPGLGQAYDDRIGRGASVFTMFDALVALTILTFISGWTIATELGLLSISVTIAFWAVQLVDAVRITEDTNRKISTLPELH